MIYPQATMYPGEESAIPGWAELWSFGAENNWPASAGTSWSGDTETNWPEE